MENAIVEMGGVGAGVLVVEELQTTDLEGSTKA